PGRALLVARGAGLRVTAVELLRAGVEVVDRPVVVDEAEDRPAQLEHLNVGADRDRSVDLLARGVHVQRAAARRAEQPDAARVRGDVPAVLVVRDRDVLLGAGRRVDPRQRVGVAGGPG